MNQALYAHMNNKNEKKNSVPALSLVSILLHPLTQNSASLYSMAIHYLPEVMVKSRL
jgi:hypothetical protein